jgi:hypothetical protein
MEIALILEVLKYSATIIAGGIAIYKAFKAKKYKDAFNVSEKTLESVVAALELLPFDNETMTTIKRQVQKIALATGSEKEKLAEVVEFVSNFLSQNGITSADPEATIRAAAAIIEARKIRNGGAK